MHRILLTTVLYSILTIQTLADEPLKGFAYASTTAPNGNEWESPEQLALNKDSERRKPEVRNPCLCEPISYLRTACRNR